MLESKMRKRITIEHLAGMVKRGFDEVRDDLKHFATKDDLKHFATKEDLRGLKEDIIGEVRKENVKVIQSNDKVVTRLDTVIKDLSAHDLAHKRIEETLYNHKKRIEKLEGAGVRS